MGSYDEFVRTKTEQIVARVMMKRGQFNYHGPNGPDEPEVRRQVQVVQEVLRAYLEWTRGR